MQRQSSGQKTPMLLQKFDRSRQLATAPKAQRAQQVDAVVALANSVLAKAAGGKRKTTPPRGDIAKLEDFDHGSLGSILRARLAKGKP